MGYPCSLLPSILSCYFFMAGRINDHTGKKGSAKKAIENKTLRFWALRILEKGIRDKDHRIRSPASGQGISSPRKIKLRSSEMGFPAFWGQDRQPSLSSSPGVNNSDCGKVYFLMFPLRLGAWKDIGAIYQIGRLARDIHMRIHSYAFHEKRQRRTVASVDGFQKRTLTMFRCLPRIRLEQWKSDVIIQQLCHQYTKQNH